MTVSSITVHAHFYQPPREDPRTGVVGLQEGAAPFHDWNEKVHVECYRPNAFSSVERGEGRVPVNNFERISFDVGPTLFRWMRAADPATYEAIVDADRKSRARLGHGNALAQAYHHSILPLSPERDARTEIRWGLADFRSRFGRDAEGLWLPETAANDRVLELLIEEGVEFTVLAPGQAGAWQDAAGHWYERAAAGVDTKVPYRFLHRDGSGRSLTLFFYEGDISHEIAFGRAAASAEGFLDAFQARAPGRCELVHAATDGETYGHHHEFTELGLAHALFVEAERRGLDVTNYATFASACPPTREATLAAGSTSWSCAHGVGRWSHDCGCSTGGEPGWRQEWRAPLRRSLEVLRDAIHWTYVRRGSELMRDPWAARDRYVHVWTGEVDVEAFAADESGTRDSGTLDTVLRLLELERAALAMFTSCAWFFNDVGGIETAQVLRYAKYALELFDELGEPAPRERFIDYLSEAKSNDRSVGTGADVFASV